MKNQDSGQLARNSHESASFQNKQNELTLEVLGYREFVRNQDFKACNGKILMLDPSTTRLGVSLG